MFNNGMGRPDEHSSADEILLPLDRERGFLRDEGAPFGPDEPSWTYELRGPYFAPFISGAQRLPGGNTLICAGVPGRICEVTSDGRMVWDFLSPFGGEVPLTEQARIGTRMPRKAIFRATRIERGDPRLQSFE